MTDQFAELDNYNPDPFSELDNYDPTPKPAGLGTRAVNTAQALGRLAYDTPGNLASYAANLSEGSRPLDKTNWADQATADATQRLNERTSAPDANDPILPFGTKSDVAQVGVSVPFSVGSMGAALGAGGLTTAITKNPFAGYAAGAGAAGSLAYRADTSMFMNSAIDAFTTDYKNKNNGQAPSRDALLAEQERLQPYAQDHGLWEALPEAAGSVVGGKIVSSVFKGTGNLAWKAGKIAAGLALEELPTETITQHGQHNTEIDAGIMPGEKRSFTSPSDISTSFGEVVKPVLLQSMLMGGGGSAVKAAYDYAAARKQKLVETALSGPLGRASANGGFTNDGDHLADSNLDLRTDEQKAQDNASVIDSTAVNTNQSPTLHTSSYDNLFQQAESSYGLPAGLLSTMGFHESGFDPNAVSPIGARGVMQFMPATAQEYGIDPQDTPAAINAAGKKMAGLVKRYNGDMAKAVAAYNYGEGNLDEAIRKAGDNWLSATPRETQDYLSRILGGQQSTSANNNTNTQSEATQLDPSLNTLVADDQLQGTPNPDNVINNSADAAYSLQLENLNGGQESTSETQNANAQEKGLLGTVASEQLGATSLVDNVQNDPLVSVIDRNTGTAFHVLQSDLDSNKDRLTKHSVTTGKRLLTPILRQDIVDEQTYQQELADQQQRQDEQANQQTETQAQDQTSADQSTAVTFQPTHTLEDGTPVISHGIGEGFWNDKEGNGHLSFDAKPIGKVDTATTDTSTDVAPSYATAPLLNKRTNQPFKTRKMAEVAIASSSNPTVNQQDHIAVPVDGGFGIVPKPNTTQGNNDTATETQSVLSNTITNATGVTASATNDVAGQASNATAQEVNKNSLPDDFTFVENQIKKQKTNIRILANAIEKNKTNGDVNLKDKVDAIEKHKVAENRLRKMRQTVFTASDAAYQVAETGDISYFEEHKDLFPDANKALAELVSKYKAPAQETANTIHDNANVSKKGETTKAGTFISKNIDILINNIKFDMHSKYFKDNIIYDLTNTNKASVTDGENFYQDGKRFKLRPDGKREEIGVNFQGFNNKLMAGIADGTLSYNALAKKQYDAEQVKIDQEAKDKAVRIAKSEEENRLGNLEYADAKNIIEDNLSKAKFTNTSITIIDKDGNGSNKLDDIVIAGKEYHGLIVAKKAVPMNKGDQPWWVYASKISIEMGKPLTVLGSDTQGFATQKLAQVYAMRMADAMGGKFDSIAYKDINTALKHVEPSVGYSPMEYMRAVAYGGDPFAKVAIKKDSKIEPVTNKDSEKLTTKGTVVADKAENIQDLGEKIGGARKDTSNKTGVTGTKKAPVTKSEPTTALKAHNDFIDKLDEGTVTAEELKAAFELAVTEKETIYAELNKLSKDEIRKQYPSYHLTSSDKKERYISQAYQQILMGYRLQDTMFSHGGGLDSFTNAVRDAVNKTTDENIKDYADDRKKALAERLEARQSALAGMENPTTFSDYVRIINSKIKDDKLTQKEAIMSLPIEQREAFDKLWAEKTRTERNAKADQQKAQMNVAATTTDGQIVETNHTKTGEALFVVKAADRVEKDVYTLWNNTAKRLGGYYSSFRGAGAVPGFQFKSMDNAEAFLKFIGGDATDAKEMAQVRRDVFADDRSQSASERLIEMADKLEEKADESIGQDRKENTPRRARQAAAREASDLRDKAMASTMRNIAEAISNGTANLLDRVRQKTQVEMLQGFVSSAQNIKVNKLYVGQGDRSKHDGEKPNSDTASYVEFPDYTIWRSNLADMGRKLIEIEGFKKLGTQILKEADDVSKAYLVWAKDNILKVSNFTTGNGSKLASFGSKNDAEIAISRSGFKGQAIVIPFKRGDNRIILSPSEAIKRGLWEGDDKMITLNPSLGAELVEKIGKKNRKLNAKDKINLAWQLENAYEKRKRLSAMGIETPAELRTAVREFIALRVVSKETSQIKEMERAMIGRANDGMDFFPTPAKIADEMIEAADIQPGMSVLEPSAGMGHIAERLREAGHEADVVEMSNSRKELLEAKGFNVVGSDFMDLKPRDFFMWGDTFKAPDGKVGIMKNTVHGVSGVRVRLIDSNGDQLGFYNRDDLVGVQKNGVDSGYDRIIMNPPFGDRRDAAHVQHAYDLLSPNGRLVAIMGEGVFFGKDKTATAFRDWLEQLGGTEEKLPNGSFTDPSLPVNTGVNARMVVIDKIKTTGDVKFSKSTTPVVNPHSKTSLNQAVTKAMDSLFGQGWTNRLMATGKFKMISAAEATGLIGKNALSPFNGGVNSLSNKILINGIGSHAKNISNIFKNESLFSQLYSSLDIPSKQIMLSSVFSLAQNRKVRDIIIKSIPVDVMNILEREQISPDRIFDNHSVFLESFSPNAHAPISTTDAASSALIRSIAVNATKILGLDVGDLSEKNYSALIAGDIKAFTSKDTHASMGAEKITTFASSNFSGRSINNSGTNSTINNRHDVTPNSNVGLGSNDVSASLLSSIIPEINNIISIINENISFNSIKYSRAWHGSPHDHNGFDSANIGTGEGAQAFGWGHYFSDAKKIAEWYRDKLSHKRLQSKDGIFIDDAVTNSQAAMKILREAKVVIANNKGIVEFKEDLRNKSERAKRWAKNGDNVESNTSFYVAAEEILPLLDGAKFVTEKGKLYEVDLAPNQDEYLDWDKPLSQQSDVVKAGLKELHKQLEGDQLNEYLDRINADWSELTGQELYQNILDRSHQDGLFDHPDIYDRSVPDDEASSHLLHSLGIRGIRYKAEAGQSDANNYVVFNDADVKIEVKYSKNGDVIAFYNPADDTTYLVHDNITQNTSAKALQGLMLHEIGVHALTLGKSNEVFKDILRRFEALKATNPKVQAAFARVPKGTKAKDIVEEALAYYLSDHPRSSLAQRIVEWFRQAVRALGKALPVLERAKFSQWANKLTEAELIGMATSALKSAPDSLQFDNVGRNREGIKLSGDNKKLLAPNGKPSNLNAMQHAQVRTEAFKKWFGDWENDPENASKVVDENGEPLVVYHGTDKSFDSFDIEATAQNRTGNPTGIYLTPSKDEAKYFGSNVFNLFAIAVNPYIEGESKVNQKMANTYAQILKDNYPNYGDDWIDNTIIPEFKKTGRFKDIQGAFKTRVMKAGGFDSWKDGRHIDVFGPNQIKSATENNGDFSESNNNIKFSRSTPSNTPADNSAMRSFFAPALGKQALGWLAGLFQRNHLIDFVAQDLPELINYKLLSQEKDNFTNQRENEIGKSYKEMLDKMDAKTMHELGRVQGMATRLVKFDPALADNNTPMTEEELAAYDAYTAMPESAKEAYATMRKAYQDDLTEKKEALEERIKAFPADKETQAEIISTIQKHFDQFKEGVYFPLNRDGAIIVKATNQDGELVIEHVATQADAYKLVKEMTAQGYDNTHIIGKDAYDRDLLAGNAANEMAALAHKTISDLKEKSVQGKLTESDFNDLFSEFNQLLINTLPDSSYRKHFIHRKGTLGESTDTLRAYAKTRTSAVKMIASLTYDHQIQDVLNNADKAIKEMDKVAGSDTLAIKSIVNELKLREAALKSTEINAVSQVLTSLGFMGALGFNIGSAAVNMLQVVGVALPELIGRHGYIEATKEVSAAYKLLFNPANLDKASGLDITKNPNMSAIAKQAMEYLVRIGKIDLTMTHDSIAAGKDPSYSSNPATRAFGAAAKYSGYFFHVAEAANRQITGMAAFNLAYKKNGGNFESAIAEAVDVIDRTQFDYGQGNRARYMMSNTARVLTLFKAYALGMSYYIGRNAYQYMKGETPEVRLQARKTLVASMAMSFATAGLFGMPIGIEAFAGIGGVAAFKYKGAKFAVPGAIGGMLIFQALLAGLGADDEDELETEFRNWLTDNFDQTTAEFVTKGPARLLPIGDIAGRTSLSELWWRSQNKQLEGTDQYNAIATALIGPIGSQIAGLFTAKKMYEDGQYSRMVESMSPAFLRNAIAANRMGSEGVTNLKGDKIIQRDLTPVELINKVIGFNPSVITNAYDANSAIAKESTKHTLAKSHLVNRWMSGDATERSDLMKGAIKDFNESVPPSERITLKSLFKSMRSRKGIDKHTQNGLYLSKKQNYLRDIGRFNRQE